MMQVHRYVAPTYAEALIRAKNELGTEALIVESKKRRMGGFLGLFGRTVTELTVAVDARESRRAGGAGRPAPAREQAPAMAPAPAPVPASAFAPAPSAPAAGGGLEREVAALRTVVMQLAQREGGSADPAVELKGYSRRVYDTLVDRGVEQSAALAIGRKLPAGPEAEQVLRQELNRLLGPGCPVEVQPGQRRVVALVGPTGVGKTTTLAKLAAQFTLERGLRVGLMTADTFRIAAIEQLRTYAEILGVPLYTVDTPAEVAEALRQTAACDLVLVDTGGRNHNDAERMQELRETLAVLRPDETHLVYSLSANPKDAFAALEHYLPLGVNRLTFTKLDEASAPGLLVNMRMRCNKPLGYIACGQSVPDDLIPADRADFTKILLGA